MVNQLISITEAADLVNKSTQTIRRLIKAGAVKYRRKKTAQGFNYMIDKASLLDQFGLLPTQTEQAPQQDYDYPKTVQHVTETPVSSHQDTYHAPTPQNVPAQQVVKEVAKGPDYNEIMDKLLEQHQSDKEKLFQIITLFQKRVESLEQQLVQLSAPKKWWQFWR